MKHVPFALAAAALMSLPGCVVYSSEEMAIRPEGPLQTTSYVGAQVITWVSLEVTCPCTKVRLVVDGWTLGVFPANEDLDVRVPDEVSDGSYMLRADAVDADVAMSVQRNLSVYRPRR